MPRAAPSAAVLLLLGTASLPAQAPPSTPVGSDTAEIAAGRRYQGGWLKRFLLGDTYRDLWAEPIRVPVLDLRRYAGGLRPTKTGSGNQTKSLRFVARDGSDFVFRLVDKDKVPLPNGFDGTVVEGIARDQVSAHHPGGAVAAAPVLAAAGLLHVTPFLAMMPDDSLLGEFRKEFAGRLGMIEAYPAKPDDAPGFAGAAAVIETEDLRELLDSDPSARVDDRAYLKARLVDMFLNDWDRHSGNWKWARMSTRPDAPWVPIPRDRDKVFIEYGGIVGVAGKFAPNLIAFDEHYPRIRGLTHNSRELDRRLLSGLEKPVWDSIAADLERRISDRVIEAAVRSMPREYQARQPDLGPKLRARRDRISDQATTFYRYISTHPDIHATDSADRAHVIRHPDGAVEVEVRSGPGAPRFRRRFQPRETEEIRLYLHGGDDSAIVTGSAPRSILVRVIGGNGSNRLVDSSSVGGEREALFYDAGTVSGIEYGEPDTMLNRRPWIQQDGRSVPPGRDYGRRRTPLAGLGVDGDLGFLFRLGVRSDRLGFRHQPYSLRVDATGEYATRVNGFRATLSADKRREESLLHFTGRARMSELEVTGFYGFGNDTPDASIEAGTVQQRQWQLHPALALSLGSRSDITFGPLIQYSTSDSAPGRIISALRPYGVGDFGQAGLRLGLYHDRRDQVKDPHSGLLIDLSATWYPAVWDVESAFGSVAASTAVYYTFPVPLRPILLVRGSGKKVFGEFPFHEAAFVGGRGSVRQLDRQRLAGDASLTGTIELQIPVARFPLILPLDTGIYGFADAGRVYLDGDSPGGWHTGAGVGVWLAIMNPGTSIAFELGDQRGRSVVRVKTGLTF
jgi:hypothetical protein